MTKRQQHAIKYPPRNGLIDLKLRWPEKTVIYEFSDDLGEDESVLKEAMEIIQSVSCIKFKKRTDEQGYVFFTVSSVSSLLKFTLEMHNPNPQWGGKKEKKRSFL